MPPKKQRTEELGDRIVEAAMALLASGGVGAVTTRAVAERAGTSPPAIYELFGDKAGLVRALFFEGFRRLVDELSSLPPPTGTPEDLVRTAQAFRRFNRSAPRLFEVMYTRPFEEFSPGPDERRMGSTARSVVVERAQPIARRAEADATDIAHALLGLVIGLATQETAGWLGARTADRDRRWDGAVRALLSGYAGAT